MGMLLIQFRIFKAKRPFTITKMVLNHCLPEQRHSRCHMTRSWPLTFPVRKCPSLRGSSLLLGWYHYRDLIMSLSSGNEFTLPFVQGIHLEGGWLLPGDNYMANACQWTFYGTGEIVSIGFIIKEKVKKIYNKGKRKEDFLSQCSESPFGVCVSGCLVEQA